MGATGLHQREGHKEEKQAREAAPQCQCLVLNMASIDSGSPTKEIPKSYLCIINSNTAGMADKELQHQMIKLGHPGAGFAHGLA